MEIIDGPAVVAIADRHYAGLRTITPFKGMFAVRDRLMKELYGWLDDHEIATGRTFFRLHVVDMDGPMDVEVGVLTDGPVEGDERVKAAVLPAGRYATLTYTGHGRPANGALIDWVRQQDLALDCVADPAGDRFGCRYEAYLTDPRTERMKTRWQIELAIRLADD
ncbi:effector-binding domain-containing protein [Actinoplanes tereljensis]|uniref:DNA gyrase inhibitor n=1 Tax=Paractinoplanes tereljensis TaxID=571912 RepID=A0A919NSE9_9ACTN|nr:GyrI-like domain-containing protein [Actinoplanes tereljensis]GIF22722.1 DNA gyrase inhibitor [Actinoplanes tereljensis]